jgi:hypothetical protein
VFDSGAACRTVAIAAIRTAYLVTMFSFEKHPVIAINKPRRSRNIKDNFCGV